MKIYFSGLKELGKFQEKSSLLNDRRKFSTLLGGYIYSPNLYNLHWHSDDEQSRYYRIYRKK